MKRMLIAWGLACAFLAAPALSHAACGPTTTPNTVGVTANSQLEVQQQICDQVTADAANNAAFGGVVAMTLDTSYTARRSVGANCTVAGNMSVTFADASTLTVPVAVGWQTFPFAVTAVNTSGTTATCSYSNLK